MRKGLLKLSLFSLPPLLTGYIYVNYIRHLEEVETSGSNEHSSRIVEGTNRECPPKHIYRNGDCIISLPNVKHLDEDRVNDNSRNER